MQWITKKTSSTLNKSSKSGVMAFRGDSEEDGSKYRHSSPSMLPSQARAQARYIHLPTMPVGGRSLLPHDGSSDGAFGPRWGEGSGERTTAPPLAPRPHIPSSTGAGPLPALTPLCTRQRHVSRLYMPASPEMTAGLHCLTHPFPSAGVAPGTDTRARTHAHTYVHTLAFTHTRANVCWGSRAAT